MNWRDMENQLPQSKETKLIIKPPLETLQETVNAAFDEVLSNDEELAKTTTTLTEVEKRLLKANYYKAVLEQSFFNDNTSEEAQEVESEFREFAVQKLQILMGMAPAEKLEYKDVPKQFSQEEELALKAWAAKLLGKQQSASQEPPVLRKVEIEVNKVPEPQITRSADIPKKRIGRPASSKPQSKASALSEYVTKIERREVTNPETGVTGVVELNVTPQVKPPPGALQPAPMPSPQMMEGMAMAEAAGRESALSGTNMGKMVTIFANKTGE